MGFLRAYFCPWRQSAAKRFTNCTPRWLVVFDSGILRIAKKLGENFMHEQLWFTALLNRLFAGPVTSLLRVLHIEPRHPATPIPDSFAMELLVFAFLLILFLLVRSRFSVDRPG